jgi:hypothetical protein
LTVKIFNLFNNVPISSHKEKLGEIVPFLEDVLKYEYLPGWKRVMDRLKDFFDTRFESDWEKKTGLPWQEWGKPAAKQ